MNTLDISAAIEQHTRWRRQFLNAFADGSYADMPLSEHRGCLLGWHLARAAADYADFPAYERLLAAHDRFHAIANEILALNENGMAGSADLLLPQLSEASYHLLTLLGDLRAHLA